MKFCVHSSLFNIVRMNFNYHRAIDNWSYFLEQFPDYHEINLVVNTSEDDTLNVIKEAAIKYRKINVTINVIESNIPYSDPAFDGKIKDVGFQNSTSDYNILFDLDECVPLYSAKSWIQAANQLGNSDFDALLIPSIDLFGDFEHATAVGQKWYLVKNRAYLHRGVFAGAIKSNGKIDISRSDSCEICLPDGSLAKSANIFDPRMTYEQKLTELQTNKWPFVFHLGALDLDQRVKQNQFWLPHWSNRAGEEVTNIKTNKDQYKDQSVFEHKLKHWTIK